MPRVSDWFAEFSTTLQARSGRTDWPDVATLDGQVYWDDFEAALDRVGASFAQADAASSAVCDRPGLWPNQYRPLILAEIRALQSRAAASEQAGAVAEALGCDDCGGSGFAVRFVHADIRGHFRANGLPAEVGVRVALPCCCPLGRVQAAGTRTPGLDRYPALQLRPVSWSDRPDSPYRYHPSEWDATEGCPVSPVASVATPADLRHLVASLRGREGGASASERPPLMPDTILAPECATEPPGRSPAETLDPAAIVLPEDEPGWF